MIRSRGPSCGDLGAGTVLPQWIRADAARRRAFLRTALRACVDARGGIGPGCVPVVSLTARRFELARYLARCAAVSALVCHLERDLAEKSFDAHFVEVDVLAWHGADQQNHLVRRFVQNGHTAWIVCDASWILRDDAIIRIRLAGIVERAGRTDRRKVDAAEWHVQL